MKLDEYSTKRERQLNRIKELKSGNFDAVEGETKYQTMRRKIRNIEKSMRKD